MVTSPAPVLCQWYSRGRRDANRLRYDVGWACFCYYTAEEHAASNTARIYESSDGRWLRLQSNFSFALSAFSALLCVQRRPISLFALFHHVISLYSTLNPISRYSLLVCPISPYPLFHFTISLYSLFGRQIPLYSVFPWPLLPLPVSRDDRPHFLASTAAMLESGDEEQGLRMRRRSMTLESHSNPFSGHQVARCVIDLKQSSLPAPDDRRDTDEFVTHSPLAGSLYYSVKTKRRCFVEVIRTDQNNIFISTRDGSRKRNGKHSIRRGDVILIYL